MESEMPTGNDFLAAHIESLKAELSAARRELAQARELLYEYFAAYPHGRLGEKYRALKPSPARGEQINADTQEDTALGGVAGKARAGMPAEESTTPAPSAPNAAGQVSNGDYGPQVAPAAPNAVPDDPVAFYSEFVLETFGAYLRRHLSEENHEKALRALAAHYMRQAAEICRTAAKGESYEAEIDMANGCADAILSAAAELERKP